MGSSDRTPLERNEAGWWSHWGTVGWVGTRFYVLKSKDFGEAFFNRATFQTCDATREDVSRAEAGLGRGRYESTLTVFESCSRLRASLEARGYASVDVMNVMKAGPGPIRGSPGVTVRKAAAADLDSWSETYLRAFYGDLTLGLEVLKVARRLHKLEDVTMLVAESEGKVSGVTALYRTPGLLGLYCLGTLPECRNRGIARSLLKASKEMADAEDRELVLQSLRSEETEPFYRRFGFEKLYEKRLLRLVRPEARGSRPRPAGVRASIRRDPGVGPHLFSGVFEGFESVAAVRRIFGERARQVLTELQVEVVSEKGYMHINATKGSIVVSAPYLKEGHERYLYLDAIHELVHIRQHMEGKELWDRRFKYVDRPTELEAYQVAVDEARRIGFSDAELVEYLKVEWVNEEDFARFLVTLGVKKR